MIVCFNTHWIATSGIDCFEGKSLNEVMDIVKRQTDVLKNGFEMEIIFLPGNGYRVFFKT